jgi:hypothetical protein
MNKQMLADITGLAPNTVQQFMDMSAEEIVKDVSYIQLLEDIDCEHLEQTLPEVRAAYEHELPAFINMLQEKHNVNSEPMSAYTLGNWVIGVLHYPDRAGQILGMHQNVPGHVISEGLPEFLAILDSLNDSVTAAEWKRAVTALSIPLMNQ